MRSYLISLSRKLKITIAQAELLDQAEIVEQMAYDLTQNDEWVKKYNQRQELEASRELTPEQRAKAMKEAMGYGNRK